MHCREHQQSTSVHTDQSIVSVNLNIMLKHQHCTSMQECGVRVPQQTQDALPT